MIDAIKLRILQGDPLVRNVRNPSLPPLFRGLPVIDDGNCEADCVKCLDVCPSNAVVLNPVRIDLGKCIFCPQCEETCPAKKIHFTSECRIASGTREGLVVGSEVKQITPEAAAAEIRRYFGKSLKLRQVSAGGCNGCELELNALSNVNFDMGRYGIEFAASPRHADGVVITGPITKNMAEALQQTYDAVPAPKIIILFGACAISGGVFDLSSETTRSFLSSNAVDLYIPGCPPHPLTFLNGILDWLKK